MKATGKTAATASRHIRKVREKHGLNPGTPITVKQYAVTFGIPFYEALTIF
ncbi:MAG: hypothetical protein K1X92_11895 [Bacteroidia bacterium]|nr:hypothetical protein [Bacteroidia bacterium]